MCPFCMRRTIGRLKQKADPENRIRAECKALVLLFTLAMLNCCRWAKPSGHRVHHLVKLRPNFPGCFLESRATNQNWTNQNWTNRS
jgi:hypothetical protein